MRLVNVDIVNLRWWLENPRRLPFLPSFFFVFFFACVTDPPPFLPPPTLQDHVFSLAPQICRSYGLSFRKPGAALLSPCIDVNISKICVLTSLDKDAVTGSLKAIITKLGEFMGSGDHVRVPFADMGALLCEKRNASFKVRKGCQMRKTRKRSEYHGDSLRSLLHSSLRSLLH